MKNIKLLAFIASSAFTAALSLGYWIHLVFGASASSLLAFFSFSVNLLLMTAGLYVLRFSR